MRNRRNLSELVADFVDLRRRDQRVTPESFAAAVGPLSDEENAAIAASLEAERLLAECAAGGGEGGPRDDVGTAPARLAAGTMLATFRLTRPIGHGGSGTVWLAEDTAHGGPVAVKVLHPVCASDPAWRARFAREGKALAKLSHPNIVPVLATGEDDGLSWLAMKWIDGRSLDFLLRAARARQQPAFAAAAAARLGVALAQALQHAHDCGLVHRDVKPGNILVGNDQPWLVDFGLARWGDRSSLTATGHAVGTPLYMAPEQFDQEVGAVSPRTDVYGLSASLIEAATGRPPHGSSVASPTALVSGLPRDLGTVLLAGVDPEPARRPATVAEFAADLQRFLDGRPVCSRRPGFWLRSRRWSRRHPVAVAIAMVVMLAVAGTGLWWSDRTGRQQAAIASLRNDTADALHKRDVGRAKGYLQRLSSLGDSARDLHAELDREQRRQAAARAVEQARVIVMMHATTERLQRAVALCDDALRFYTGRDQFDALVLKAIAQFRLRDWAHAYESGLTAAKVREIPVEGEVKEELEGLARRMMLAGFGGEVINDTEIRRSLSPLADDKIDQLRQFMLDHAADSSEMVLIGGVFLSRTGSREQAMDLYDRVLDINPRSDAALLGRARLQMEAGDLKAARESVRTAVTVAPERSSNHVLLARIQHEMNQPEEALRTLATAIERVPENLDAYMLRAEIFAATNREDSAMDDLMSAADIDPDAGLPMVDRADLLMRKHRYEEALQFYRAAIGKLDVLRGYAQTGVCAALINLGRLGEAAEACRLALQEEPMSAKAWGCQAQLQAAAGDSRAALQSSHVAVRVARRLGNEQGVTFYLERYWALRGAVEGDAGERTETAFAEGIFAKPAELQPEALAFDVPDMAQHLRRIAGIAAADDSTPAFTELEQLLAAVRSFASRPGPRLDRSLVRRQLAQSLDWALSRLERDEFAAVRELAEWPKLASKWQKQVAAWRRS